MGIGEQNYSYAGMNRSSIFVNCFTRFMKASPEKVGRAMRSTERFRRCMFLSGRKRRRSPFVVL